MEKYKIYIDFEAITPPFTTILGSHVKSNYPFCYTIGYIDKYYQEYYKTRIIKLKSMNIKQLYRDLKEYLTKDIQKILEQEIEINENNIQFIGWNPQLENEVTKKIFNLPTKNIININLQLSLSVATKHFLNTDKYFEYFDKLDINDSFYRKILDSTRTGIKANYVGFLLYCNYKKRYFKSSELNKIDFDILKQQLVKYNKDDVKRLIYMEKHQIEVQRIIEEEINKRNLKNKYIKEFNFLRNLRKYLSFIGYVNETTISELIEKLNKRNEQLITYLAKQKLDKNKAIIYRKETIKIKNLLDYIDNSNEQINLVSELSSSLKNKVNELKKYLVNK